MKFVKFVKIYPNPSFTGRRICGALLIMMPFKMNFRAIVRFSSQSRKIGYLPDDLRVYLLIPV